MAKFRIECLVGKTNKAGVTSWYWQPSATLKRAGWKALSLGQGGAPEEPPEGVVDAARAENRKVAEWRAGGARPAAVRKAVKPLTVADLVRRYREEGYPSVKHPGRTVAPATRDEYDTKFKTILAWGDDTPIAAITPQDVEVLKNALLEPARAGRWKGEVRYTSAHATLRVLRTLLAYAEQKRLIPRGTNPATEFSLSNPEPRSQVWWQPARMALFETAAGDVPMEAAIALAFSAAQREADLLRLSIVRWDRIEPYLIEDREIYQLLAQTEVPAYDGRPAYIPGDVMGVSFRQGKTNRPIGVPVVGADRARVEAAIARARTAGVTTILFDDRPPPDEHWAAKDWRPRPWTMPTVEAGQRRFIRRFAELRARTIERLAAAAAAGDEGAAELAREIEDLQFRDFRRTGAVTMAERGVSDINIAAVTGWSLDYTKRIVETYVPRTIGSAARAIALSHARGSTSQSGTLRREGEAG